MKYALLALTLIANPAFAQNMPAPRYSLTLEQRRDAFERQCRLMAPDAWRGEKKRDEWLVNCRREAP